MQTAGGLQGGGKGRREQTRAARTVRGGNLQDRGKHSLPFRRALGPQGPGENGVGGAWRPGAESRCAEACGRSRATRAGRRGARCTGSPRTRVLGGGSRACLPAHVYVIFELECGADGAAGAWGRPRLRRDAVRPALRPPRALLARLPGRPTMGAPHRSGRFGPRIRTARFPRYPSCCG